MLNSGSDALTSCIVKSACLFNLQTSHYPIQPKIYNVGKGVCPNLVSADVKLHETFFLFTWK